MGLSTAWALDPSRRAPARARAVRARPHPRRVARRDPQLQQRLRRRALPRPARTGTRRLGRARRTRTASRCCACTAWSRTAPARRSAAPGRGLVAIHEQLRERGIPAELLDGAEASRRWPGMRFEDTVLFSPDAGVARASVALEELERRIVAGGGEVRWQTPALRIEEDADGVTVHTAAGVGARRHRRRHRRRLDERAARAASRFPRSRVTEESPAHFAPRDPAAAWPSFNHFVAPGTWPANVYGMPTPGEGVKVGFHTVGDVVDPDARPFRTDKHADAARRRTCASGCRGSIPTTAAPISCTYTSTARRGVRARSASAGSWSAPDSRARASSSRPAWAPCSPTSRSTPALARRGGVPPALTARRDPSPARPARRRE